MGSAPKHRLLVRTVGVLGTGVLLLSGCTGGPLTEDPGPSRSVPASPSPSAMPSPSETTPPEPATPIEFEFRRPDPVCPPASALVNLPLPEQHTLVDPSVHEDDDDFLVFCTYQHSDSERRSDDMVLVDHVLITSEITLFRTGEGAPPEVSSYPPLPVSSTNLEDWTVAGPVVDEGVWWEGCDSAAACEEGQRPARRTYAQELRFASRVGNLEFYGRVTYIAQRLPVDVESRILAIFRDLVLATMESYERVG